MSEPAPSIVVPRAGLMELLRTWNGDGPLYEALAAVSPDGEPQWSAADVRLRARRVLLGGLESELADLPQTVAAWERILPITTVAERLVVRAPRGGTDWPTTARRFGWPPSAYVARSRHRVQDETALTCLVWLAGKLQELLSDVGRVSPLLVGRASPLVAPMFEVAARLGVAPVRPDRSDLMSLTTSGTPWPLLGRLATRINRAETNPEHIAFDLLEPDPEAQNRLFHLATFGEVVRVLRSAGCRVRWRSPIGGTAPGPRLEAITPEGSTVDMWFEAAGARSRYRLPKSAYQTAVASISGVGGSIGADVALIEPGARALLLECKWSADTTYVGRDGFHQAASYALDARSGIAPNVWSFIVGPEEVVPSTNVADDWLEDWAIVVGSTAIPGLETLVRAFLAGARLPPSPDPTSP